MATFVTSTGAPRLHERSLSPVCHQEQLSTILIGTAPPPRKWSTTASEKSLPWSLKSPNNTRDLNLTNTSRIKYLRPTDNSSFRSAPTTFVVQPGRSKAYSFRSSGPANRKSPFQCGYRQPAPLGRRDICSMFQYTCGHSTAGCRFCTRGETAASAFLLTR